MIYIIDANNLAGKLGILFQDSFDKEMIGIMKDYFSGKKMKIVLVFDSNEPMGDKIIDDNVEIIYTPRDNYYNSADDKILEIAINEINSGAGNNQITVVTDDIDLRESVQEAADKKDYSINLIRSTDFAFKILNKKRQEEYVLEDERGLGHDKEDEITKEMMKRWA